jgi:hypothetical protein
MRAHDAVGDVIGFALFRIIGMADRHLGLDHMCAQ